MGIRSVRRNVTYDGQVGVLDRLDKDVTDDKREVRWIERV